MIATDSPKDKPLEGRRRADRELDLHSAEHREFMLIARCALIVLLKERETATIDDLRERVKIPKALVKAGVIRRAGFATSSRATSHARPLSAWKLADADAASKWLTDNPAPVPVTPPTVQQVLFNDGGH